MEKNRLTQGGSLKKWCGIREKIVNKEMIALYESECNEKFHCWDKEKRYKEMVALYESEYNERFHCWDKEKQYPYYGIRTSLASWEKANQIHNWFIENIQNGEDNCNIYEVSKKQLESLLDICKKVFEHSHLVDGEVENKKIIEDSSYAKKLLPNRSGHFFGSTEYDQEYLENIEYTIRELTNILEYTDFENEIIFYDSVW